MSRRAPPPAGPGLAPAPLRRSVDEAALNAKLRELREAMSKEKVAREGARARQAAGGGHIWASSRASANAVRVTRNGGRLRELSAEELERIQRIRQEESPSARAEAAMRRAEAEGAADGGRRRRLAPIEHAPTTYHPPTRAPPRPTRPRSPRFIEHVIYSTARGPTPTPAPPPGGPPSHARPRSARPGGHGAYRPRTAELNEPLEEFGGELHHAPVPEPEPEPEPAARFGTRGGRVEIVNETPSLWEGEVDEEANRREFEEALREWRSGGAEASATATTTATTPATAAAAAMETQTETVAVATRERPRTARLSDVPKGSSYFERLLAMNAERVAGSEAMRRGRAGAAKKKSKTASVARG